MGNASSAQSRSSRSHSLSQQQGQGQQGHHGHPPSNRPQTTSPTTALARRVFDSALRSDLQTLSSSHHDHAACGNVPTFENLETDLREARNPRKGEGSIAAADRPAARDRVLEGLVTPESVTEVFSVSTTSVPKDNGVAFQTVAEARKTLRAVADLPAALAGGQVLHAAAVSGDADVITAVLRVLRQWEGDNRYANRPTTCSGRPRLTLPRHPTAPRRLPTRPRGFPEAFQRRCRRSCRSSGRRRWR